MKWPDKIVHKCRGETSDSLDRHTTFHSANSNPYHGNDQHIPMRHRNILNGIITQGIFKLQLFVN